MANHPPDYHESDDEESYNDYRKFADGPIHYDGSRGVPADVQNFNADGSEKTNVYHNMPTGGYGSTPSTYDKDNFVKSGADLKNAEKNSWGAPGSGSSSGSGAKSASQLSSAEKGEASDEKGGWKTRVGNAAANKWGMPSEDDTPKPKKRGGIKKGWILGFAGGSIVIFLGVLIAIFMFLGNFKNVHFAEVLRSVGMARFNYSMRQNYARTIFDSAVLTDKSTGSAAEILKGSRNGLPKQIKQLGREGTLKFDIDRGSKWDQLRGKNTFTGLEINGTSYSLDDYAKKAFPGKKFNDLSYRERLTVRSQFNIAVRNTLNDALASNSRWFRWKTYGALRSIAGIRMFKWADKARAYFGKSPQEARKLDVDETVSAVDDANERPKTGINEIDDEADNAKEEAKKAAETGTTRNAGQVRTKWGKALRTTTKVSDAVFVTTAACIIHSLSNSFDQTQEQTQKQALRLGHDPLTTADQIKEGDTTSEAVGADSARYDDAEKSVAYKQATGEGKLTKDDEQQISDVPNIEGPAGTFKDVIGGINDFIETSTVGGPFFSSILDAFGAGGFKGKLTDTACNVMLNQYVQYSIAGTEILVSIVSAGATKGVIAGVKAAISGGLQVTASIGLGELLGSLLDKAVGTTAGLDYSGTTTGVPMYNQEYVGVTALDSFGERTINYGAPASTADTQAVQKAAMNDVYRQNSQLPFSQRYFAIDNPFSLTGKAIAIAPSNFGDLTDMARSGLSSMAAVFSTPQRMFGTLGNLFMPHQYASAEEDQSLIGLGGVTPWPQTLEDQQNMDSEKYDFNGAGGAYYDAHKDDLNSKYDQCYQSGTELQSDIPDICYSTVTDSATGKSVNYLRTTEANYYRYYMTNKTMAEMNTGDLQ